MLGLINGNRAWKWIADASFVPYIHISFLPVIPSNAGKSFPDTLETLCSMFISRLILSSRVFVLIHLHRKMLP